MKDRSKFQIYKALVALPLLGLLTACAGSNGKTSADTAFAISSIAKPKFTVNGQQEVTVDVGDSLDFEYQAQQGVSAQGAAIADSDDNCSIDTEGELLISNLLSVSGKSRATVQPCQAGHTYKFVYKITDDSKAELQSSEQAVIVHVKGEARAQSQNIRPKFTVNGEQEITVDAGDIVKYEFNSGSDTFVSSSIEADSKDSCGDLSAKAWLEFEASRLSGLKSEVIAKCQAGHSYKVKMELDSASGKEELSVIIHVRANASAGSSTSTQPQATPTPQPEKQPLFSVNGAASAIVKVGETLHFKFDAGSGQFMRASVSSDSADSCVLGLGANAWARAIDSLRSGSDAEATLLCEAGHTYTIDYEVQMPDQAMVKLSTKVEVQAQ